MRSLLALGLGLAVLLTGFWAYQENYRTRQTIADLRDMQREIGALRAELSVLEVEWAYLNRPERLRALADLNFERLQLIPMRPEHFGHIDQIAYPPRPPAPEPSDLPALAEDGVEDGAEDGAELLPVGYDEAVGPAPLDVMVPEPVPDPSDGQFP